MRETVAEALIRETRAILAMLAAQEDILTAIEEVIMMIDTASGRVTSLIKWKRVGRQRHRVSSLLVGKCILWALACSGSPSPNSV